MKKRISRWLMVCMIGLLTVGTTLRADTVTEDTNFIKQAYLDLLQRPASPGDVTFGLAALGSESRYQFALTLDTSTDYYQLLVNSYFQSLLGRAPLPSESSSFIALLGSETDEAVLAAIAASPEFFAKSGGTDSGFVIALFHDFLNKTPSSSEVVFWVGALGTLSRDQVAALILGSTEYETDLVTGYYEEFLHRSPDITGLNLYVSGLNGGTLTDEQAIASLIASDEYFNLAQPPGPTPEPSTATLACLSVAGLILLRRQLL